MTKNIKTLFLDVDGCISKGRGHNFDLQSICKIKNYMDKKNITLILASGRSQPYLEALSQILGINAPFITENGAGIYDSKISQYIFSSLVTSLWEVRSQLEELTECRVIFEPGKDFSLSFRLMFDTMTPNIKHEYNFVVDTINLPNDLTITHSSSAIDIIPANTSKGNATQMLANILDIDLKNCAGFGDSINDLSFLQLVGFSGAPANAEKEIKTIVDFVSKHEDIKGLTDFIKLNIFE